MADAVSLDVLAIAAHPDDIEITSAGLLIRMIEQGSSVGAVDLTRGEMGTYGDENIRLEEAASAAKVIGLSFRENLALADSDLESTRANKLALAALLRQTRPEMVVLPHWEQRHPDHRICSQLGYDACFLAGLQKLEIEGEPFRPRRIIYASYFRNTDYSFLVDISDQFEKKCRAVAAYQSQFGKEPIEKLKDIARSTFNIYDLIESGGKDILQPGVTIYDLMHTRARQLGQLVGVEYAEAYTVKEQILIDNPLDLLGNSI